MKILIPTDYSQNAYRAFEYAHQLFQDKNADYLLLNIQNARQAGASLMVDINQDLLAESHRDMNNLIEKTRLKYPDINLQGIVTAGTFVDSVIEKAAEFSADVIAVGTKGASGIKGVLMGSNTSNLIGHTRRPLIVVPDDAQLETPKKIVLAADFVKEPNPETYDVLLDLCYAKNIELSVLHVAHPGDTSHFTEKNIPFNTEGLDYKLYERINKDVEYAIIEFVEKNDMDMISLVKSKGGFIHELFHTSLTKKLGMHINTPLLVLH